MLEVRDDNGLIGTIDLVDGKLVSDPPGLVDVLQSRLRRGMTPAEAFADIDGWSNGWVWVRSVEELARRSALGEPANRSHRQTTSDAALRASQPGVGPYGSAPTWQSLMPVAARETLGVGSRVSYEDVTNARREGSIVEILDGAYRIQWHDGDQTVSDLRQHGWYQLASLPGNVFDGAEIIYAYTRQQAIDDGELIALDDHGIAKEAGFIWPVAFTRALWRIVEPTDREARNGQSVEGRLWDVLMMARFAIQRAADHGTQIDFSVIFHEADRGQRAGQRRHTLRLETGLGDWGEPVVTIGFPADF